MTESNGKPKKPRPIVGCEHAIAWVCRSCGSENLQRLPERLVDDDEARATLIDAGAIQEWEDTPDDYAVCVTTTPAYVVCGHCRSEFTPAMPPSEDDE